MAATSSGESGGAVIRVSIDQRTPLHMLYATDAVALGDVRVNDSGYLEAFAHTARTGVQRYLGSEMGRPDLGVVNVYRDAADVFSHASLHSFEKVPVTVDHPPGGVSAANWKQVAVGTTGEEVLRDGERLKIGLKIMDAAAIEAVRSGKRELSVGYQTEIVWGDGVAPDGTPYQARQTKIIADHIAIVTRGRAGAQCRIGDAWPSDPSGASREPGRHDQRNHDRETVSMKTLTIDGHPVELSDAAVIAVSNLQKQLGTAVADNLKLTADLNTAKADHGKAIEAKDGEILKLQAEHAKAIEAKDAEIGKLQGEAITADKLDAAIAERDAVVKAAKPVLGDAFDAKGKSVADIRRAAVAKRLGDKAVEGKTDDHVAIAFDTLTAAGPQGPDSLGRAVSASVGDAAAGDPRTAAFKAMTDHLTTAWQPKSAA